MGEEELRATRYKVRGCCDGLVDEFVSVCVRVGEGLTECGWRVRFMLCVIVSSAKRAPEYACSPPSKTNHTTCRGYTRLNVKFIVRFSTPAAPKGVPNVSADSPWARTVTTRRDEGGVSAVTTHPSTHNKTHHPPPQPSTASLEEGGGGGGGGGRGRAAAEQPRGPARRRAAQRDRPRHATEIAQVIAMRYTEVKFITCN